MAKQKISKGRTYINQTNLRVKHQFIKQLRAEYQADQSITNLWQCFLMYFGFLRIYADPKLTFVEPWQMADYQMSITQIETMWHRTRRGGKSIGLTIIAVFLTIIEFGVYAGGGIWRAPAGSQLKQAGKWFAKNPFVICEAINSRYEVDILDSITIDIGMYSKGRSASLGASWFIEDEGGDVIKGSMMEEWATTTRGIVLEGKYENRRIIHASTGAIATTFESDYLYLSGKELELGVKLYSIHPWQDCHWIDEKTVEEERAMHKDTPWYVDQEYECLWVNYGGAVFQDYYWVGDPKHPEYPSDFLDSITADMGGLDWNGELVGHILMIGAYDENYVYLLYEIKITAMEQLRKYCNLFDIEVEGAKDRDGFNAGYCAHASSLHLKLTYSSEEYYNTGKRIMELKNRTIIYDRFKCPWFHLNVREASYDKNQREATLQKKPNQHGLDAALHMVHAKSSGLKKSYKRIRGREQSLLKEIFPDKY